MDSEGEVGGDKNKLLRDVLDVFDDTDYCMNVLYRKEEYRNVLTEIVKNRPIQKIPFGNVTDIIKKLKTEHYVYIFNEFKLYEPKIVTIKVHESFKYMQKIIKDQIYAPNGVFINYFIRKFLYNLRQEKCYDSRAAHVCELEFSDDDDEDDDVYDRGNNDKCSDGNVNDMCNKLPLLHLDDDNILEIKREMYNEYKKVIPLSKFLTDEVINNIWNVTQLHLECFYEPPVKYHADYINKKNLECIMDYCKKIHNTKDLLLNPIVDCDWFQGDAHIIDPVEKVIIGINVSKFNTISLMNFVQLILYSIGYYIHTKEEIRTFRKYNTLLGIEHTILLPNLDYIKAVQVLDTIIKKKGTLQCNSRALK